MWNTEYGINVCLGRAFSIKGRREATLQFHIPHSEFRIIRNIGYGKNSGCESRLLPTLFLTIHLFLGLYALQADQFLGLGEPDQGHALGIPAQTGDI